MAELLKIIVDPPDEIEPELFNVPNTLKSDPIPLFKVSEPLPLIFKTAVVKTIN